MGKPNNQGEQFCQRLINVLPTPEARIACITMLEQYAGRTIYLPLQKKAEARKVEARRLIESGMLRADVALAIQEKYSVSYRTASRDLSHI